MDKNDLLNSQGGKKHYSESEVETVLSYEIRGNIRTRAAYLDRVKNWTEKISYVSLRLAGRFNLVVWGYKVRCLASDIFPADSKSMTIICAAL